jgi:protein-L-isoaspartate(D-aspartate) O-methyltransferase
VKISLAAETRTWMRQRRAERLRMIERQIRNRGVRDRRVLAALARMPRELFVAPALAAQAYDDVPLPATHGQTISQPYMVALMTAEARLGRRSQVLEIGTGTGYHAAVMAILAHAVWTVERVPEMVKDAANRLSRLGITNVTCLVGDGALGHAPAAPYHAIIVAAAVPAPPPRLLNQLDLWGRLVIPVGDRSLQDLMVYQRTPSGFDARSAGACRFVPLVSPAAFGEE